MDDGLWLCIQGTQQQHNKLKTMLRETYAMTHLVGGNVHTAVAITSGYRRSRQHKCGLHGPQDDVYSHGGTRTDQGHRIAGHNRHLTMAQW
jgi:hypothetical protein